MANQRLTDRTTFVGTISGSDLIHMVDVSDLSQDPAGSSYKLTLSNLFSQLDQNTNIYNINGTLTGNRTVSLATFVLTFDNGQTTTRGETTDSTKYALKVQNSASADIAVFRNDKSIGFNTTPFSSTLLSIKGTGTTTATFPVEVQNSSGVNLLQVYDAGQINVGDADESVYMGLSSGLTVTSAVQNTMFGVRTGDAITSGSLNSAFGNRSMRGVVTGSGSSAFGHASLQALTSGDQNTAVGTQALQLNTTGASNTAVGHSALSMNISGGSNTSVGAGSSGQLTGDRNTAVGFEALKLTTTGTDNVGVGDKVMESNTTGINNSAVGRRALFSNTTGGSNVAIGIASGALNTTGSGNVFIGADAGRNRTVTSNQLFIHNQDTGSAAFDLTKSLIYGIFNASPTLQQLHFNAQIINMDDLPVGNGGVASGELYVDTAANILTNADNIVARKV